MDEAITATTTTVSIATISIVETGTISASTVMTETTSGSTDTTVTTSVMTGMTTAAIATISDSTDTKRNHPRNTAAMAVFSCAKANRWYYFYMNKTKLRHFVRNQKLWATVAACIPILFLSLFAIGEGIEGWPHDVQILFVLALIAFAWMRPRAIGYALAILGAALSILYAASFRMLPIPTILLVECIVFVPLIVSGFLFATSKRSDTAN